MSIRSLPDRMESQAVQGLPRCLYAEYAGRYLQSMREYPTAYTSSDDVAQAIYAAASDGLDKLRYPAGADSLMLAELRRSLPEPEFVLRMRSMFGG